MEFVVLGAGALGSIISGHLARAGESVSLIARGERARYLQQNGITLTGLAEFNVTCPVITDPKTLTEKDVLILAVKSQDVEIALSDVSGAHFSSVLSVQNGVYGNDQITRMFGASSPLGATAAFSGEVKLQGGVSFTANAGFFIGELPSGISTRVSSIVKTLNNAGINTEASPDIQSLQWSKFVLWVAYTSISVITRQPTYRFLADYDTSLLCVRIMREMAAIANDRAITLQDVGWPVLPVINDTEDKAIESLNHLSKTLEQSASGHKMSALQDLENRKELEIEATLGYAVSEAQTRGINIPTLDVCYSLIRGINRSNRKNLSTNIELEDN